MAEDNPEDNPEHLPLTSMEAVLEELALGSGKSIQEIHDSIEIALKSEVVDGKLMEGHYWAAVLGAIQRCAAKDGFDEVPSNVTTPARLREMLKEAMVRSPWLLEDASFKAWVHNFDGWDDLQLLSGGQEKTELKTTEVTAEENEKLKIICMTKEIPTFTSIDSAAAWITEKAGATGILSGFTASTCLAEMSSIALMTYPKLRQDDDFMAWNHAVNNQDAGREPMFCIRPKEDDSEPGLNGLQASMKKGADVVTRENFKGLFEKAQPERKRRPKGKLKMPPKAVPNTVAATGRGGDLLFE